MTISDILENPDSLKEGDLNEALSMLKESIGEDTLDDIATIMKLPEIERYIQYLIRLQTNNTRLLKSDPDYMNLYLIVYIIQSIYNYSQSESPVNDYDYDRLYDLMEQCGDEVITTPQTVKSNIVKHTYPSLPGTLKKIYALDDSDVVANGNRGSLSDWIHQIETIYYEKTGQRINMWEEEVYVFPKWDGVSVTFEFDADNNLKCAITRGDVDVNEGKDVTFIFATLASRTCQDMRNKPYGLKSEVMVKTTDVIDYNKKFKKDYKSARSIASSIINSDSLDGRETLLEVVGLRTTTLTDDGTENLQELAEDVFNRPYLRCRLKDTKVIREFAYNNRNINGLNTDGAVIYIINETIRQTLGRKDHKNLYEIAYKFNEDVAYQKLKGVQFNVTKFGRIFPVAEFESVISKGNTVKEASLGSIARLHKLKLRKGDTVKILYEIVPYITFDENDPKCRRSKNPIIQDPEFCPECGEPTSYNTTGSILSCINPNCPCRQRGKILNYIKKIGMKNIGEGTISAFHKAGLLNSIEDLYKLQKHRSELINLPNFEETSIRSILAEIDRCKEISAPTFMGAIGIESIGKETFVKVLEKFTIEDLIEFAEDDYLQISKLVTVKGIKETQAKKILDGVRENKKFIERMTEKHLTIYYPSGEEKEGSFIAVFHKFRSERLENLIRSYGGTIKNNLTKKTNMLIIPNGFRNEKTSKLTKAREWDIPILEYNEVEPRLKEKFGK